MSIRSTDYTVISIKLKLLNLKLRRALNRGDLYTAHVYLQEEHFFFTTGVFRMYKKCPCPFFMTITLYEFNTFYSSKKEFINLKIKSDVLQIKFDLFQLFAFSSYINYWCTSIK